MVYAKAGQRGKSNGRGHGRAEHSGKQHQQRREYRALTFCFIVHGFLLNSGPVSADLYL